MVSIKSFVEVAIGLSTFKEESLGDEFVPVTKEDFEELKRKFPEVQENVIQQAITVRKGNLKHVEDLLNLMVEFRKKNDWPMKLSAEDVCPIVHEAGVHETTKGPEGRPMLVMYCAKVDPKLASAKDYQKHAQWLLELMTEADTHCHTNGIALRLDFKGASFSVLRHFGVADIYRGMNLFRTFPLKVKHVEVANASTSVRVAIRTVLLVTSKAIRSKVAFV